MAAMKTPREVVKDIRDLLALPRVRIDLMFVETKGNDPFYATVVREFYDGTRRRHRKFPLIRALECGVAVCRMPGTFEGYFASIESAARRNYKKAMRLGYEFRRIDYNAHLADITAIRRSAAVRQGQMPDDFLKTEARTCQDPASLTDVHDYAYFGVLKEGQLVAYAGCLVSGEAFLVEQLYGHESYQVDGVVPMLLVDMVRWIPGHFPHVKYCIYGTYFGAGLTMRRFKRKFGFVPHRVEWVLAEK